MPIQAKGCQLELAGAAENGFTNAARLVAVGGAVRRGRRLRSASSRRRGEQAVAACTPIAFGRCAMIPRRGTARAARIARRRSLRWPSSGWRTKRRLRRRPMIAAAGRNKAMRSRNLRPRSLRPAPTISAARQLWRRRHAVVRSAPWALRGNAASAPVLSVSKVDFAHGRSPARRRFAIAQSCRRSFCRRRPRMFGPRREPMPRSHGAATSKCRTTAFN